MNCLFILEDITGETNKQRDWETPGGVSPIAECMFMGQRLDIGVCSVSHTLSGMSQIIRNNIGTWIVCGLPGEDPRFISTAFSATPKQAEKIKGLQPGEVAIFNPGLWPKPLYGRFDPLVITAQLTEANRRFNVCQFLINVIATPPVALPKPNTTTATEPSKNKDDHSNKLSSDKVQMLITIITGPPLPITKIYKQMGLSGTQGRRILKRLEDLGYIQAHTFSTGRIGGKVGLVEVSDCGWRLLEARGLHRPKAKTNGGWEHDTAAILIEADGKKNGYSVSFEVEIGGMRIDVQLLDKKTGRRLFYNIGISNPAHEVDSIEKFTSLPASQNTEFTLVARDVKFAKKVKAILKERNSKGSTLSSIKIKLLTDFLDI